MKLSADDLRRLVKEELEKLVDADGKKVPDPEEYEPGAEADTLEKHIDIAKALKIQEDKLARKLKLVRERRHSIVSKLLGQKA